MLLLNVVVCSGGDGVVVAGVSGGGGAIGGGCGRGACVVRKEGMLVIVAGGGRLVVMLVAVMARTPGTTLHIFQLSCHVLYNILEARLWMCDSTTHTGRTNPGGQLHLRLGGCQCGH